MALFAAGALPSGPAAAVRRVHAPGTPALHRPAGCKCCPCALLCPSGWGPAMPRAVRQRQLRAAAANSESLSPLVPVVLLPQPKKKLKPQAQEKQNSCFPSFPPSCKACFCWTGCCCQPPRQKPLRRCAGGPRNPHHAVAQQSPDSTTDCTALLASPSPRTPAARAHNICLCPFTVPI